MYNSNTAPTVFSKKFYTINFFAFIDASLYVCYNLHIKYQVCNSRQSYHSVYKVSFVRLLAGGTFLVSIKYFEQLTDGVFLSVFLLYINGLKSKERRMRNAKGMYGWILQEF